MAATCYSGLLLASVGGGEFLTARMPMLMTNQRHQSTEEILHAASVNSIWLAGTKVGQYVNKDDVNSEKQRVEQKQRRDEERRDRLSDDPLPPPPASAAGPLSDSGPTHQLSMAGLQQTQPAHLMNSGPAGQATWVVSLLCSPSFERSTSHTSGVFQWLGEWVCEWRGEWVREGWVSEWVRGWVGEWGDEWVSEWMSVWMNEWVGE